MRKLNSVFAASLENGLEQEVLIEVRPGVIRCFWNGRKVLDQALDGRRFEIHPLWQTDTPTLPGVGSWRSPTQFSSIEIRAHASN